MSPIAICLVGLYFVCACAAGGFATSLTFELMIRAQGKRVVRPLLFGALFGAAWPFAVVVAFCWCLFFLIRLAALEDAPCEHCGKDHSRAQH